MTKLLLIVFLCIGGKAFAQDSSKDSCLILSVDSLKRKGEIICITRNVQSCVLVNSNASSKQFQAVVFKKRTKEEREQIIEKQSEERKAHRVYPKRLRKFIDRSWYDSVESSSLNSENQAFLVISTLEKGQYILEIDLGIRKSPRKNIVTKLIVQ